MQRARDISASTRRSRRLRILAFVGTVLGLVLPPSTETPAQLFPMTFWSGGCAAGSESFSTAGTHNFVVPRGCSAVTVRVWGAGGGGGGVSTGTSNSEAAAGGGGGLAQGTLAVTPNELLTVVVGSGGGAGANHASNGGGGGGGGGYSKIARGGTDLVIGAGGGGGGGTKNSSVPAGLGGAGGGTNGVAGTNSGGTPTGGGGGTTAGGAAGTGSTNGTVGSSLAGGAGGTSTGGGAGGSAGSPGGSAGGTSASSSNAGGGGGGGGYFGGGGGGAGNPAAGGGGGSAYVKPSETFAALSSGNGSYPGGENLIDYGAGAGIGGVGATSTPATTATAGAEGRVVIFWHRESFDFAVGTSTFVVPDGCSSMRIKAWGGGGGGSGAKTNNSDGNVGGGGGFTDGFVAVTPGETLSVIVGGGGNPGENQSGGGGGGGGGGGRTEIVRSGTPLLIAGGGGGAGGGANAVGGAGGAGGGASGAAGGDGQANGGGDGGTDSAGGAAGSGGNSPVATAGSASSGGTGGRGGTNTAGGAGGYNQGGAGEGGNGGSNGGGGGGGGGYYGGGGGGGTSPGSGGGGGSSFGTGTLSQASGSTAAGSGDADYRSATGTGGTAGTATLLATAGRGGILLASCGGTATGSPTIAANPGYAEGDVRISVDLPNDALDSFDHIVIRRLAGSTPPAAACDGAGGEIVHTFNAALADPSAYVDSPGSPGSFFSYRACVYDSANNLVAAPAKSGVRSEKYHMLIFTSSTLHNGNLGGLSGADAKCQAAADAAAIDVEFQALVSTAAVDLRFRTNFPLGLPIYRTDGVTVVADLPELWNAEAVDLLAAVSKDEYQATPTSDIWTGSKRDAFKATETCTSWTSSASGVNGKRGDATKTQQNFLEDGNDKCDKTKHLYCLSADVVTYGTKKTLSGPYQVPTGFHFYRVNAADQAPTTYNATFDADEGANLGQSCLWKVLFADTNDGETDYDVIDGSGNLITRIFFPMCAGGTCHAIVNRCGSGAYDAAAKTAYVVERGTTSTAGAPTDSFTNSCTTSAAPLAVDGWDNDCDGTMDELTYVSCTYSDLVTKTVGAAYTAPATQTCNGNTANFGSCTWTVPNGRNCYYANTICSGAPTTTVDEWNSSSAQSGTVPNDLTHTITGTACFTTAGVCQSQKNIVSRTAFTTVDCTYKYATYP